jgi:hypothetical protein
VDTKLPIQLSWLPPAWAHPILGKGTGALLATPTKAKNQHYPSMKKHPGCKRLQDLFGTLTPEIYEWLMGWPAKWTG